MPKKDKKGKSAEQKAQKLAKQTKKAAKGEKKVKAKNTGRDADSDVEDVDLDAVLAAFAEEQAKFLKVTEQPCSPPSPRSSCTLIGSPSNRNELFLFGGECYDGATAAFFNDLYVYLIDRGEWRSITSGNSPLPRSGHAWCRGGNTGGIYLSFGEFSSPKQNQFYHYQDFWHLDADTREWTKLESKGKNKSPPARSGHRMTYFKNYIILFGGFQDTSQQTKYLQDTWIYDCKENLWHEMKSPPASQKPDARSSFSFLPHESGAVLYGGYSRVKTTTTGSKAGKGGPQRNILKPMVHQDTWFLRIIPPPTEAASDTPPTLRWERRKRPANIPNPARAGAMMAYHKGRGVTYGGVHDVEESEEGIDSEFFNDMFIWNIDRNRFFPLALRRPKAGGQKKPTPQAGRARDRGKADEEELLRNLAALEAKGTIAEDEPMTVASSINPQQDKTDPDDTPKRDIPMKFEMPHPRFNTQLAVQDDALYIYGGTFERKDTEITFSDLYSIDLGKLDGVKELYYIEPANWNAVEVESEDDEDDEGEEDEDYDEEDIADSDEDLDTDQPSTPSTPLTDISSPFTKSHARSSSVSTPTSQLFSPIETEPETSAQYDPRPFPRPFESLRDFYARTAEEWQNLVLSSTAIGERSVKEIRKRGFEMAEERWWDCREEIRDLEDAQEAAGIGEVVNLAERNAGESGGGAGGGAGRRR